MQAVFAKLEKSIGYTFQDIALLERALTHRSWAYEKSGNAKEEEWGAIHNETLEFVGDSVLGLAVAECLYLKHPTLSEGDLTLMKHRLVSTETLSRIATGLDLGDFIRFGKGEEKTGGRRKEALLADALEAVIAAVFFDSDYIVARNLINRIFVEDIQSVTPTSAIDYKTMLQERLQAQKREPPDYIETGHEGPSHNRTFFIEVRWDNGKAKGIGKTKKAAEMMAAQEAIKALDTEKNILDT